jgi:hypothetical protein
MATSIKFLDALKLIWDSGVLIMPDDSVVYPNLGNYLNCVSGATPVFMTLGSNEYDLIVFNSNDNGYVTIEDDGRMTLVDTRGRRFTYGLRTLVAPTKSYNWPRGTSDSIEP